MQRRFKCFPYIFIIYFTLSGCCVTDESPDQFLMHCTCSDHACCTADESSSPGIEPTPTEVPTPTPTPPNGKVIGQKHAVLISACIAQPGIELASEFWDDLVLQYQMLGMNGFEEDNIHVFYDNGQDFNNVLGHPMKNLTAVNKDNINEVFKNLNGKVTKNDILYIWWMGHGMWDPDTCKLYMPISGTVEEFEDSQFLKCINQVFHYKRRIIAIMTCFSGGIVDDMSAADTRTVILTSSACDENSYSLPTCYNNVYHAEFNYALTNALIQRNDCDASPVDSDTNGDKYVSFQEAHKYILRIMLQSPEKSTPQIGEVPSGIGISTFLSKIEP